MLENLENLSGIKPSQLADVVMVIAVDDLAVKAEFQQVGICFIDRPSRLDRDVFSSFDGVVRQGVVPDNLNPECRFGGRPTR
jgi:hypothetical protein